MPYTESEIRKIEKIRSVFGDYIKKSEDYDLVWSDKIGYVWLVIGLDPIYADVCSRISSADDLCRKCFDNIVTDVLLYTGNDHAYTEIDPLEWMEIELRWKPYVDQLPEYRYICEEIKKRH